MCPSLAESSSPNIYVFSKETQILQIWFFFPNHFLFRKWNKMPSVVIVLYIISNQPGGPEKPQRKNSKQEAPEKIVIIIIIIITLYRSVERIQVQSHSSSYVQGLLPQNSLILICSKKLFFLLLQRFLKMARHTEYWKCILPLWVI